MEITLQQPQRWDLISECATKLSAPSSKLAESTIRSLSGGEGGDFRQGLHSDVSIKLVVNGGGCPFVPNPKCCKDLFTMLLEGKTGYTRKELVSHAAEVLYHEEGMPSLKPIVLLPPIHECCSSPILIQVIHLFTQQVGHMLVLCFMESAESVIAFTIIAIEKYVMVKEQFSDIIMIQFPILKSTFNILVHHCLK